MLIYKHVTICCSFIMVLLYIKMESTDSPDEYDASALGESNRKLVVWANKTRSLMCFFCVVTSLFADIPFTLLSLTFTFVTNLGYPSPPFPQWSHFWMALKCLACKRTVLCFKMCYDQWNLSIIIWWMTSLNPFWQKR